MLTRNNFNAALKLCFDEEPDDFSMDFDAMNAALKKAGLDTVCLETVPKEPTNNMLIECQHKTEGYWHYIVYDTDRQTFLDPIPNPPAIEEYNLYRAIEVRS